MCFLLPKGGFKMDDIKGIPQEKCSAGYILLTNKKEIRNMVIQVTLLAEEWTQSTKGGALSTFNRQLGIHLAQHPNVKVSLLIPKCSPEDKQDAEKYRIKVIEPEELTGFDPVYWLGHPPDGFSTDFVVGHDVKLGSQGNVIKRNFGCKWIQAVHTNAEEMGVYVGAISAAQEEHENQVKLCENANMVITIGPKLQDSYTSSLRSSGKEVFNLTPGIFDEFCDIRQEFQEGNTCRLLIFGRGDDKDFQLKGFDVAAKAVAALDDKAYRLVIVGAPDGKQEQLAAKLEHHGISRSQMIVRRFYKDREELANLFCEADLLLMPSGTEAFGLDALEALSASLPILVTSNSGLAEALKDVPIGSQCIVETEDDWAKKIKDVRKNLKTRHKEAKMLREQYKEKYSWKDQCDTLVKKMTSMNPDKTDDAQKKSTGKNGSSSHALKRHKGSEEDVQDNSETKESPAPKKVKVSPVDSEEERVSSADSEKERVKDGTPTEQELQRLACRIANWEPLGRQLQFNEARLVAFKKENPIVSEQAYKMLLKWKERDGKAATYQVLFNALLYETVSHRDLAEEFCFK